MKNISTYNRVKFSVVITVFFLIVFNVEGQEMGIGLVKISFYEWGYVNNVGAIIHKENDLMPFEFSEERLRKVTDQKYGFLNCRFDVIIRPVYEKARDFKNGYAAVRTNGKWGFISRNGLMVVPPSFDACEDFSNGMAAVRVALRWGYVDTTGTLIIPAIYENIEKFSNGVVGVRINNTWVLINQKGDTLLRFPPEISYVGSYINGRIRLRIGRPNDSMGISWCYVDINGKRIISDSFDKAEDFSEGLARVRMNGKWGFINEEGIFIIPQKFGDCEDFKNGVARVIINDKWGIINLLGEMIVQPTFTLIGPFNNGIAPAYYKRKWGYINKFGVWVIQPIFLLAKELKQISCRE